jgi:DNA-binding NarL/FixJ family response regulator
MRLMIEPLTSREHQVLELAASGRRNHEIAGDLCVSLKTVEFHMGNILGKLGVRSRTEAIVRGHQTGVLCALGQIPLHSDAWSS